MLAVAKQSQVSMTTNVGGNIPTVRFMETTAAIEAAERAIRTKDFHQQLKSQLWCRGDFRCLYVEEVFNAIDRKTSIEVSLQRCRR